MWGINDLCVEPEVAIGDYGLGKGDEPSREEVMECQTWIRENVSPRKNLNRKKSSYALKHIVEKTTKQGYISNGAFILAAFLEGYMICPTYNDSPNAYFNMRFKKPARR